MRSITCTEMRSAERICVHLSAFSGKTAFIWSDISANKLRPVGRISSHLGAFFAKTPPIWEHLKHRAAGPAAGALATLLVAVGPASAQSFPAGCFVRDYSPEHLAAHPEQGIAGVRMLFDPTNYSISITAVTSDTGQAAQDGATQQLLFAEGACDQSGRCQLSCSGDTIWLHRDEGPTILVRTEGAQLDAVMCDTTAPSSNLAEVIGEITTYRLNRIPIEDC